MSLYADKTFENLMQDALSRISDDVDKREGSIIYDALAPIMAEIAQVYIGMDFVFDATYITTAPREYLILRAADRGITPKEATKALFRADFNMIVENGTRFSCNDLNFAVVGRLVDQNSEVSYDTETAYAHIVECETAGSKANTYSGTLLPIEYVEGLTYAELISVVTPGADEEDTEVFRNRVLQSIRNTPFGGSINDYKQKVLSINGVQAVKVIPVWDLDINPQSLIPNQSVQNWVQNSMTSEVSSTAAKSWINVAFNAANSRKLKVGGTVQVVIMATDYTAPSQELISQIQKLLDPESSSGEGEGLAPIGHIVTVMPVETTTVNVSLTAEYKAGWDFVTAKPYIESAIDKYFLSLKQVWDSNNNLIVRISQLERYILDECAEMLADVTVTSPSSNVTLPNLNIPVRGTVNEDVG